jgi:hypothetical protein
MITNVLRYHVRRAIILPNGWWFMPASPVPAVPADPGSGDLAWLDRDPERECWLDRAREHDEPPEPEEYEDYTPLTPDELAEIEDAATDDLLAVAAAASGRRGPGQPGSARVFPGQSSSPAAAFGPGMIFDLLPGCAQLAVAADAAAGDDDFDSVSEAELVGIMCAWDRVEAHAAARKLAAVAELSRRNPEPAPAGFAGRVTLTAPLATLTRLAGRPGELSGLGPVDPWLTRDLATAAARNPGSTWCLTVTDSLGHAVGHGCARPEPKSHRKRAGPGARDGPGFAFEATADPRTWRLRTPGPRPDLIITVESLTTDPCDHRHQASGHDPGGKLRHLTQVRHATCTSPICRRPAAQADFEHNIPYEAGGRTCLCNTGPKCRRDHRLKQHPKWRVDQLPDGTFRWTTPAGRTYTTEPTRYPI